MRESAKWKKSTKNLHNYFSNSTVRKKRRNDKTMTNEHRSHPTQSGGGPHQIIPHLKNLRKQKRSKGKNTRVAG